MEKNGVLFAHVPEPIFSYGGRAGWRMLGWVAVIACYWTSATLLAHVPEPIVLHGGRTGWVRTVFSSHTCRSHLVCMVEEMTGEKRSDKKATLLVQAKCMTLVSSTMTDSQDILKIESKAMG